MSADAPLTEFEFRAGALRGSTLTLYANRLEHHRRDFSESVPLAQLAAVRIAFEREPGKMKWALALFVVALVLFAVAGPLHTWAGAAASEVAEHARPESLAGGVPGVLQASFRLLARLAGLLPALAWALVAWAAALAVLFWLGVTTLTLTFAAVERAYPVRGRNRLLLDFADTLSEQLARAARR